MSCEREMKVAENMWRLRNWIISSMCIQQHVCKGLYHRMECMQTEPVVEVIEMLFSKAAVPWCFRQPEGWCAKSCISSATKPVQTVKPEARQVCVQRSLFSRTNLKFESVVLILSFLFYLEQLHKPLACCKGLTPNRFIYIVLPRATW